VAEEYTTVAASTAHHRGAAYDDTATIAATLAGGAGCTFVFGLDAPYGDDRIALHGTRGSIVVEGTLSQWWSDAPGSITTRDADRTETESFDGVDTYRLQVDDFARYASGGSSSIAGVDDAVAVAEFSEAVYRSAATGERELLGSPQA
jgi:predicted dehydrogenase